MEVEAQSVCYIVGQADNNGFRGSYDASNFSHVKGILQYGLISKLAAF